MKDMTDQQVVEHLRNWVKTMPHDVFAWPTDACGYQQHIRFVTYRNAFKQCTSAENLKAAHGQQDYGKFVLEYAKKLEVGEIPSYQP